MHLLRSALAMRGAPQCDADLPSGRSPGYGAIGRCGTAFGDAAACGSGTPVWGPAMNAPIDRESHRPVGTSTALEHGDGTATQRNAPLGANELRIGSFTYGLGEARDEARSDAATARSSSTRPRAPARPGSADASAAPGWVPASLARARPDRPLALPPGSRCCTG